MSILDEAAKIIYGDREKTYGDPALNLKRIALIWKAILGIDITPDQVCLCMTGVKLARLANDPLHHDSQVDTCGYMALLERIQQLQLPEENKDDPRWIVVEGLRRPGYQVRWSAPLKDGTYRFHRYYDATRDYTMEECKADAEKEAARLNSKKDGINENRDKPDSVCDGPADH